MLYCVFDFMFENVVDLCNYFFFEWKKWLKVILLCDKLIVFSYYCKVNGMKFFVEVEWKGLEGVMVKCVDSVYVFGSWMVDWLKIKIVKW